jgi:hypothetical protein
MKSIILLSVLVAQLCAAQQGRTLQSRREIVQDLLGGKGLPAADSFNRLPSGSSQDEKKSPALAAFYSLLLPGMGELYAGSYNTGKYFTIAEGALWIGWGGMQWYGSWIQSDARRFATQHARVASETGEDQYFIDIGNFISVYAYNEQALRDRDVFKTYNPQSSSYWRWDTDADREQYRLLRVSSDNVFNNSRFVLAAIGINHLISAVNAGRLAISHNSSTDESSTIDIHANVIGTIAHPDGIVISMSKSF